MGDYTVELIRDGKAVERAEVQADDVVAAAKTWGPVTIPFGAEPDIGQWIRVTHPDGCTTTWFEADQ
jgi:D-serine deaminase-like pyridoxal phosphate-dependent protein